MSNRNQPSIFCKLFFAQFFILALAIAIGLPLWVVQQAIGQGGLGVPGMVLALTAVLVFGSSAVRTGRYAYQLLTNQLPPDKLPKLSWDKRIGAIATGSAVMLFSLCGGVGLGGPIDLALSALGTSLGLSCVLWGIHDTVRAMRGDDGAG